MRTAVVFFATNSRDRILNITRALARGMEAQGHQVDIIDGDHDINAKLTMYQYIAVGTEALSNFSSKIPEKVSHYLASSGMVAGKRCFAFVSKNVFGASKALSRLMRNMEKEGMYLKYSSVLNSPQEAEEIGKRLHIK
jgi:menaquinone-dependent protoporphyrinogen IX oxidase